MPNRCCCPKTECTRNGNCSECLKNHRDKDSPTKCQREAKKVGIIIKKPTLAEKDRMMKNPIWSCEASTFDWFYDCEETCLLIEGEVKAEYESGSVSFGAGDLVVFPQGLKCVWSVIKPVKKHYVFK